MKNKSKFKDITRRKGTRSPTYNTELLKEKYRINFVFEDAVDILLGSKKTRYDFRFHRISDEAIEAFLPTGDMITITLPHHNPNNLIFLDWHSRLYDMGVYVVDKNTITLGRQQMRGGIL